MQIKNVILRKPLTSAKLLGVLSRFCLEEHQSNYIIIKIEVEVDKAHTFVLCEQIGINIKNRVDTKNVRNILRSNFHKIFKKDSIVAKKVIVTFLYSDQIVNNEFNKRKSYNIIQQLENNNRTDLDV